MKLLHVVASYLPAVRYGAPSHRRMAGAGRWPNVAMTCTSSPPASTATPIHPVAHETPMDIDGVKVWYFQSPRFRRGYWAPAMRRQLRSHVGEFDLVHTHAMYLWPLWAAARAAHAAGVPYVVSPRGMLEKGLIEQKRALMKAGLIAFIERRTFDRAATTSCGSGR